MSAKRAVVGPATVALSVVTACGVPNDEVTRIEADELPAALRATTTTATHQGSPAGELADVGVYWIRDKLLVPEAITFESAPGVERVITLLERGPTTNGRDADVRSAMSQPGVIRSVVRDDDLVIVELSNTFSDVAGSDQVLALGQIVATLTSLPDVARVEFRRGGELLEVPIPDGSLVRRPVTRVDYASLLSVGAANR